MARHERYVVIDPAFLGDVVFDGPLVRALKLANPGCVVGLVVRPPADAIAERIEGVDRVHVFDKRGGDRGLMGLLRVARELREAEYDAALIPHPSLRSTLLAALARIPVRIGSARGHLARLFLTDHRPEEDGDTFVAARLRLAGAPLAAGDTAASRLEGTLRAGSTRSARFSGARLRLGLLLGSEWPTKRWAIDQAGALVRGLDPLKVELVLLGSSRERALFDDLRRAAGPGVDRVLAAAQDAVGGPAGELIEQIARLDLLIAGDTGPLHAARALGVPVIALFGPTSERRHRFGAADRVLAIEIECRPCSAHGGLVCPEGHHRCMKELGADRVLGAVGEALAARANVRRAGGDG